MENATDKLHNTKRFNKLWCLRKKLEFENTIDDLCKFRIEMNINSLKNYCSFCGETLKILKIKPILNHSKAFDKMSEELSRKHEISEIYKIPKIKVISSSLLPESIQHNKIVQRDDFSKNLINVKKSPVKKSHFNEEMVNDLSENDNSKEEKANFSQRLVDSILDISSDIKNTVKETIQETISNVGKIFQNKEKNESKVLIVASEFLAVNPSLCGLLCSNFSRPETSTLDKNRSFDIEINTDCDFDPIQWCQQF
ncbi:hypothetical protein BpHYR1_013363 [Brachionus plicatilis]|uniref:Uncharacterized protein n=1 Tax=Brachionus plicatilis TaxID=10195 RepID=A0A3M7T4J7_BRAPC|nr:hypothetical protein BpHYR1_013363 [Brachionus plicatilis]